MIQYDASELNLTLGEVAGAVGDAEQSVTYADRSGDAGQRMINRTTHADALHQTGRRAAAETRFREAEQMQAKDQPGYPLLYSLRGFQYCDLLLAAPERAAWQSLLECAIPLAPWQERSDAAGKTVERDTDGSLAAAPPPPQSGRGLPQSKALRAVSQRAAQTLKWGDIAYHQSLLDIALDHLTLGRAALYAAILERSAAVSAGPAAATLNTPGASGSSHAYFHTEAAAGGASPTPAVQALPTARRELDAAVDGLRRAGQQIMLPRGLLTRAWLRFLTGARTGPESAQADLDEAWEMAERGPMKLFMADILLTRCRLFGRKNEEGRMQNYPWRSPEADLSAAEQIIRRETTFKRPDGSEITARYARRDEELADAQQAILRKPG